MRLTFPESCSRGEGGVPAQLDFGGGGEPPEVKVVPSGHITAGRDGSDVGCLGQIILHCDALQDGIGGHVLLREQDHRSRVALESGVREGIHL